MTSRREFLKFASAAAASYPLAGRSAPLGEKIERLVFVHGRGQQGLDPKNLKQDWIASLKRGAASINRSIPDWATMEFPYYGDLLEKFVHAASIPLTSEVHARGSAGDEAFLAFQASVAQDISRKAGISEQQIDEEYGNNPEPRGPLNWKWVQAILRTLDRHNGGGMNSSVLELFTRDVYIYCTNPAARVAVDRTVQALLTKEPTVIVAHSLGTVVAYSVLKNATEYNVPLLVTVGCPLGIRAVRDLNRPIHWPETVGQWYNAFDTRDVVALYPLDEENFDVGRGIQNNPNVRNHTDNRHGIDGYLDDMEVAKRILDAIG